MDFSLGPAQTQWRDRVRAFMDEYVRPRTGDYDAAVKVNETAAAVDRAYIKSSGAQGMYPMMYYSHNLHFIAMCSAMNGNYLEAKKGGDMLAAHVGQINAAGRPGPADLRRGTRALERCAGLEVIRDLRDVARNKHRDIRRACQSSTKPLDESAGMSCGGQCGQG